MIPSTVKVIDDNAFKNCPALVQIQFCREIEEFVNEMSLPWSNYGVSRDSFRTYSFLAQCNIPTCLGMLKVREWKDNIYDMMKLIFITPPLLVSYFETIDANFSFYERLLGVAPFLKHAIWKSNSDKHVDQTSANLDNGVKMKCDDNLDVMVISLNVLSFPL